MLKKVKKERRSGRPTRAVRAVRSSKYKNVRNSRSLSERRQLSSVKRARKVSGRRSIAAQSVSRPAPKLEKKAPQASKRQTPSMSVSVYNLKGKVIEKVSLPKEIFGVKINDKLMSQAVRVYRANQRLGTVSTKTRGEVKGSTRKIYRQKGTGRARHGSIRAPIFVGGGRVFGPKPRDFRLSLPKKMKRVSLFSALSSKLAEGEIKVLIGLEKIEPKTKKAYEVVKNLDGKDQKILLITPSSKNFENVYRSFRNIEGINILEVSMLNAYQVLDNKLVLLMKEAIDSIKNKYLKGRTI